MKIFFGNGLNVQNNSLNNFCNSMRGRTVTHIYNFPSSVVNADNAFNGCSNLKEFNVDLSSSLKNMNNMFNGCVNLSRQFNLPYTISNIAYAFTNSNIKGNINFPSSIIHAEKAFYNTQIKKLNFVPTTTQSSELNLFETFKECTNLIDVTGMIPNTIKNVGFTFANSGIESTPSLEDGVIDEIYCNGTFEGCYNLKTSHFQIPRQGNIKSVFKDCSNLVEYPYDINGMNIDSVFYNCSNLISPINIVNCYAVNQCFTGCSNLTDVNIIYNNSSTISKKLDSSFSGCSNLNNLLVQQDFPFEWNGDLMSLHENTVISLTGDYAGNSTFVKDTFLLYRQLQSLTKAYIDLKPYFSLSKFSNTIIDKNIVLSNFMSQRRISVIIPEQIRMDPHNSETAYNVQIGEQCFSNGQIYTLMPLSFNSIQSYSSALQHINAVDLVDLSYSSGVMPKNVLAFSNVGKVKIKLLQARIPDGTFLNCCNLKNITIDLNETFMGTSIEVGHNAFRHCYSLNKIIDSNENTLNINFIGENGFYNCSNISDMTFTILPNAQLSTNCIYNTSIQNLDFNSQAVLSNLSLHGLTNLNINTEVYNSNMFGGTTIYRANIRGITSFPGGSTAPDAILKANYLDYPDLKSIPSNYFNGVQASYVNIPNVISVGRNAFSYATDLYVTNQHLMNDIHHATLRTNVDLYSTANLNDINFHTSTSPLLIFNGIPKPSNDSFQYYDFSYINFYGRWNVKIINTDQIVLNHRHVLRPYFTNINLGNSVSSVNIGFSNSINYYLTRDYSSLFCNSVVNNIYFKDNVYCSEGDFTNSSMNIYINSVMEGDYLIYGGEYRHTTDYYNRMNYIYINVNFYKLSNGTFQFTNSRQQNWFNGKVQNSTTTLPTWL